jgi:hypothetical protein
MIEFLSWFPLSQPLTVFPIRVENCPRLDLLDGFRGHTGVDG